jgi:hypothetical protein
MRIAPAARTAAMALATLLLSASACTGNDLHLCAHSAAMCQRDGFTETSSASLSELASASGDDDAQYRTVVDDQRTLAIDGRHVVFGGANPDAYATIFEGTTDPAVPARLEFDFGIKPWGVAPLPNMVSFREHEQVGPCVAPDGDDTYASEHLSGSSVRETDGRLLVGSEHSRLRNDGVVERASRDLLPEVELTWFNANCQAFCGAYWKQAGDELWRTVALRVRAKGAKTTDLLPGDRMRFDIDGQRYILALENAAMPQGLQHTPLPKDTELCGRALWTLYRNGVVIDVEKAGDAPKPMSR